MYKYLYFALILTFNLSFLNSTNSNPDELLVAILANDISQVKFILDKNSKLYEQSNYLLSRAIRKKNIDIIKLLIQRGADINYKDESGVYPIHLAILWQELEIVKLLINHGADINVQDDKGLTPLHFAILRCQFRGKEEIVNYIISKLPDFTIKDASGRTAFDWYKEIRDYIKKKD